MSDARFVLDTNILVSAILMEDSTPSLALQKAEMQGTVLYSYATLAALSHVLSRPKFSLYVTHAQIDGLLARIQRTWEMITITHQIRACRDPKDDMFLELAVNGNAAAIITGDSDLLALNAYRNVAIITPTAFIA